MNCVDGDENVLSAQPLDYEQNRVEEPGRPCLQCGGRAVRGNLLSRTGIRFVPDYLRHLWATDAGAIVTAYACRDCGAVTLAIEPKRLPRLVKLTTPSTVPRRVGRVAGQVWRWLGGRREK